MTYWFSSTKHLKSFLLEFHKLFMIWQKITIAWCVHCSEICTHHITRVRNSMWALLRLELKWPSPGAHSSYWGHFLVVWCPNNMQSLPDTGQSRQCTCCHTKIEAVDQTCSFPQSQYSDAGPTSPCTDPILQDIWPGGMTAGSHPSSPSPKAHT